MRVFHVHIPYDKIGQYSAFIKKERLNLEIYFSSKALDSLRKSDIRTLKSQLDYKPQLTIHAPFMDLSPGAVDSKIRAVTIERFSQVLDIAEELSGSTRNDKVKSVVFHSGYEKWKYGLNPEIWLEGSLMTWKPLLERAEGIGVKIAVENIFEDEPTNLSLLAEKMGSSNFGICFDTGHLNLFSKVKLEDWIAALKPYIIEFHLHDNDKTSDQHLPIGDGTFDFDALFSTLKGQDLIYTLEAHSAEDAIKSIEKLKMYL